MEGSRKHHPALEPERQTWYIPTHKWILAISTGYPSMLQSTAPERMGNKECTKRDTWISMGKGNRRDLLSRLGTNGDGNVRDWVGGQEEGRVMKQTF